MHIVGRLKEQFKSSKGKFIVPSKIERLLTSHPYLEQVCVFGSGMTQPVVAAQLSELGIAQDKAILLNQLTDFLRETNMQLEASERLESLWLSSFEWSVDNQLMTPTLKVKRHQVEELFKPYVVQKIQTESCNLITHISELQQVINHMHVKQN